MAGKRNSRRGEKQPGQLPVADLVVEDHFWRKQFRKKGFLIRLNIGSGVNNKVVEGGVKIGY